MTPLAYACSVILFAAVLRLFYFWYRHHLRTSLEAKADLIGAINHGLPELASELIARCPSRVNDTDRRGNTPLHMTIEQLDGAELACTLLRAGANPSISNNDGNTPLHLAAKAGETRLAAILLLYGADPTIRNYEGHRPPDLAKAELPLTRKWAQAIQDLSALFRKFTPNDTTEVSELPANNNP